MSTENIAEREKQLLRREGFLRAKESSLDTAHDARCSNEGGGANCPRCVTQAVREFPMPKIARVVVDPCDDNYEWRVEDGALQTRRTPSVAWRPALHAGWSLEPQRIAMWADLFASPTELIDDDGSLLRDGGL